jgi:hypothetical protein
MSANKPQPQKGGQKPNQEDEKNRGSQNRDQQGGQEKGLDTHDTPRNPREQGQKGGR